MPDTKQPYKRHKFKFNDEFKVVVGADVCVDTQSYNVPKNVLVKSSDFLRKACNKEWAEGQTKVVHLPEAKPKPFEIYLQYLYSGDVVLAEEIKFPAAGDKSEEAREDVTKAQVLVIDSYILADMLLDIDAKNALVDQLVFLTKRGRSLLPASVIQELFAATTKESPM
ncbi:hypothetical protein M409DRAFT_57463 [Zasmidium cellare ATCC 36951]|uniref:BTB domain-containing protein n=1 Tax=Zasmidium cellare ATCC 36951 TaxID=1080233 RepID=A0A6A6C965_ZASCE|nr:uncharacterized protein M409DRAFT_57463 [Zasmidium cellare ATCC 36951]KAF2163581.1 hypothetical protein M409DRAFT_57463 [Zasmidium cellare ATCC 36951]